MQNLQRKQRLFIEGEDFVSMPGGLGDFDPFAFGVQYFIHSTLPDGGTGGEAQNPFRFTRMFRPTKNPVPADIDPSPFDELAKAMEKLNAPDHPSLPAGYTYLAQFIAHDMTFNHQKRLPNAPADVSALTNLQSPALDLESLYGSPPGSGPFFLPDGIRMRIGLTEKAGLGGPKVDKEYENDLPRGGDPVTPRKADIADERNDDNLLVAQTQVAFMKFHNAVADFIEANPGADQLSLDAVREKVIKHYQWIILHDLLPKIINEGILEFVLDNPAERIFKPGDNPAMPVEFAFAAYRLGHCMIRDKYELNRVFQTPTPPPSTMDQMQAATIGQLMEMAGLRGRMQGLSTRLPSNWIIDWTRFYDFSDFGIPRPALSNNAKRISTDLSAALGALFRFVSRLRREQPVSLGTLDLVRGFAMGLPTGQEMAANLGEPPLSRAELLQGVSQSLAAALNNGFLEQTPLWYYILKEAEVRGAGERLGAVGSRIIAETFVGLIEKSRFSILGGGNWSPDLAQAPGLVRVRDGKPVFEMADMLVFVDKHLKSAKRSESELNPLG